MSVEQRLALHKQLQDGSEKSTKILNTIFHKHKDSKYLLEEKYRGEKFERIRLELDRLQLAAHHPDMFENIIISNCESAANIFEVESLLSVFGKRTGREMLKVVPLLEKRQDLEKYESILTDYIKARVIQEFEYLFDHSDETNQRVLLQKLGVSSRAEIKTLIDSTGREAFHQFVAAHPELREYLKKIQVEVMVGFSDTGRVSGLPALISVQQVQEDFIKLCEDFGVTPKIYLGPGGDPTRGGLGRRDPKKTLQGNARSNLLNTAESTQWFRENQFYQTHQLAADPQKYLEFSQLPEHMRDWLHACKKEGAAFYEQLFDTKKGLGQLAGFMLGQGAHWMVSILNSSSRAAQRGGKENTGDRTSSVQTGGVRPKSYVDPEIQRAITWAQMHEMLRDNFNFVGSGYGLRAIGVEAARQLYYVSDTFKDMVDKTLLGASTQDLTFLTHVLFADHPHFIPANSEQQREWADECRTKYPETLETIDIEKMSKDPNKREGLLLKLSRLFAYLAEESAATKEFLFAMTQAVHDQKPLSTSHPTDLLYARPEWQQQTIDAEEEAAPLCHLFARQAHHVACGKNLDQLYRGLNEQSIQTAAYQALADCSPMLAPVSLLSESCHRLSFQKCCMMRF